MRATVAAWIGSENLGDELIFAALAAKLSARGVQVLALSVDPAATCSAHPSVQAVRRRSWMLSNDPGDVLILGGGGLLQDETSTLNLKFHLMPLARARRRGLPVAGVALGAGRLTTRLGRRQVGRALTGVDLTVRDAPSAELLAGLGLPRPVVAADLALSLPSPTADPVDRIVACLRPWSGGRHRLPVALRRPTTPDWFLDGMAKALSDLGKRTDLAVHLVAFDASRDHAVHEAVAERMTVPVSLARPGLADVLSEVAASKLVVSTRFHGAVAAVLAGRPVALIGYSPKVDALAADLGAGAALVGWDPAELESLGARAASLLGRDDDVAEALSSLRTRERHNDTLLDRLLAQTP